MSKRMQPGSRLCPRHHQVFAPRRTEGIAIHRIIAASGTPVQAATALSYQVRSLFIKNPTGTTATGTPASR
jgi:hypothetical protein